MNFDNLPLLAILVLSVIGHNNSVAIAAASLLFLKLLGLDQYFPFIESHGLSWGIIILTMAILVPIANQSITAKDMVTSFRSPVAFIALGVGLFMAWIAGRGVPFMSSAPEVITPLLIGTIIGVCFFQGLAIGPLIASGVVWGIISLSRFFH
ncbi:MAG: DUF441 domain-containing protein [Sporomusaceae bacterium]|nr:DUF441 domain-containing protein [Sporomusaceae bacterium]